MEIINLSQDVGSLDGDIYNLKAVNYASIVSFKLLIKNIKLVRVKFGCGSCTKGDGIQKGSDVELLVNYTPRLGGAKGEYSKSITVYHTEGEIKITFKGKTT